MALPVAIARPARNSRMVHLFCACVRYALHYSHIIPTTESEVAAHPANGPKSTDESARWSKWHVITVSACVVIFEAKPGQRSVL